MNELLETFGKRTPYASSPGQFDALHDRILRQTVRGEGAPRRPTLPLVCTLAAAAAVVAVGVFAFVRQHTETADRTPDIETLLSSAPAETLRRAAAENYDDILYNQQL